MCEECILLLSILCIILFIFGNKIIVKNILSKILKTFGKKSKFMSKQISIVNRIFKLSIIICALFMGGIIVSLFIPNYLSLREYRPMKTVENNMFSYQTMIESYSIDTGGYYPVASTELLNAAKMNGYWEKLYNPYKPFNEPNNEYTILDSTEFDFINNKFYKDKNYSLSSRLLFTFGLSKDNPESKFKGYIIYFPYNLTKRGALGYTLYASDEDGHLHILHNKIFTMSNG